jgi:hypothetical protein
LEVDPKREPTPNGPGDVGDYTKPPRLVDTLKELAETIQAEAAKAGITRSTQSIMEELAKRGRALAGVEGKRQFGAEFAIQAAAEMVEELLKEVG